MSATGGCGPSRDRTAEPGRAWLLEVPVPQDGGAAELIADRLWRLGATAVAEHGRALVAGFAAQAMAAAAVSDLRAAGTACTIRPDDGAWRSAWRAYAGDVAVGPIVVRTVERVAGTDPAPHAGHGRSAPAVAAGAGAGAVVEIDPGDSFGSGHHPSTRQCLAAVARWARPGVSLLDIGTGSGVLAVAGAVMGAAPVVAIDLDPAAVRTARANAAANGVAVIVAAGGPDSIRGSFRVVVANLGGAAAPLALVDRLASLVERGGRAVIGGLLAEQVAAVAPAYARLGSVATGRDAGWACLVLSRAS